MPSGKPLAMCLQGLGFLEKSLILEKKSKWSPRTKSAAKSIFDFTNLDDGACFVGDEKSRFFDQKAMDWVKQNGAMYWSAEGRKELFTHAPAYPEDEDAIFYLVQQVMLGKHANDVSNNRRMSRSQAKSGYDVSIFGVGEDPVNRPMSSYSADDISSADQNRQNDHAPIRSNDPPNHDDPSHPRFKYNFPPLGDVSSDGDSVPPIVRPGASLFRRPNASNDAEGGGIGDEQNAIQGTSNRLATVGSVTLILKPLHHTLASYTYIRGDEKALDIQRNLISFIEQQQEIGQMNNADDVSRRALEWVKLNGETVWPPVGNQSRRARAYVLDIDESKIVDLVTNFMCSVVCNDMSNVLQELRREQLSGLAELVLEPAPSKNKRTLEEEHERQPVNRNLHVGWEEGVFRRGSEPLSAASYDQARQESASRRLTSNDSTTFVRAMEGTVQATTDGERDRGLIVYDSRHSDHRPNDEPTEYLESGHALENPGTPILYEPVSFSNNMYGRIIFMVGASPSHVGNWHPMGMKEGRDAATFRAAVFGRLELLGEPIGTKEIVAKLDWVRGPIFVDTDDYYHLLLSIIKTWPGWRLADQESQCIVYVTLES